MGFIVLMVLVWCPACLSWLGGLGSFEFVGKCSGKAISPSLSWLGGLGSFEFVGKCSGKAISLC